MITVGIDEVGRGSWAGPLVAGAVILGEQIAGLRDSKKLSQKQREHFALLIRAQALTVGIGWVTPQEVDEVGLTKAVGLAMQRALEQITLHYDEIIIDGNVNYFPDDARAKAIIKADDTIPSVSAASIAAKVARDAYMAGLDKMYPGYGFSQHVGYGTAGHLAALKTLGVSAMHRRSYKPIQALLAG